MKFIRTLIIISFCFTQNLLAEVIDNKKITNKEFDIWRVSCEEDEMLENIRCKLFVEITDGTTFFVNPNGENEILIVSKDAYFGKNVFLKVDNGKLIESKPISDLKYGIINFEKNDITKIYKQIQNGQYIYIRFSIKDNSSIDGNREITIKFSLSEFQKAFAYYNKQINKYNKNY